MKRTSKKRGDELVRGIPPEDYRGSIEEWKAQLQALDLWDGAIELKNVKITFAEWQEVLYACEQEYENIED